MRGRRGLGEMARTGRERPPGRTHDCGYPYAVPRHCPERPEAGQCLSPLPPAMGGRGLSLGLRECSRCRNPLPGPSRSPGDCPESERAGQPSPPLVVSPTAPGRCHAPETPQRHAGSAAARPLPGQSRRPGGPSLRDSPHSHARSRHQPPPPLPLCPHPRHLSQSSPSSLTPEPPGGAVQRHGELERRTAARLPGPRSRGAPRRTTGL